MDRIYTLGYGNWTIDEVDDLLRDGTAVLLDVRHAPYTTKPGFSKEELAERFGERYRHVPAFGNVAYREERIELANPERGLQIVRAVEPPPILMCGCSNPRSCHRSVVATLLADHLGGTIEHLRPPTDRSEPTLFDDTQ